MPAQNQLETALWASVLCWQTGSPRKLPAASLAVLHFEFQPQDMSAMHTSWKGVLVDKLFASNGQAVCKSQQSWCRPLLHAKLRPGVACAWGVEVDRIKCVKACAFLKQTMAQLLQRNFPTLHLEFDLPTVQCSAVEEVRACMYTLGLQYMCVCTYACACVCAVYTDLISKGAAGFYWRAQRHCHLSTLT